MERKLVKLFVVNEPGNFMYLGDWSRRITRSKLAWATK